MKRFAILLVCTILWNFLSAQEKKIFWTDVSEADIAVAKKEAIDLALFHYRTIAVDLAPLQNHLKQAPLLDGPAAKSGAPALTFPMPDGTTETFRILESPVLMPGLAAKYPEIRSFKAIGLTDPGSTGRFDYSPRGLHASFRTSRGEFFIEPYADGQNRYHAVYFASEVDPTALDINLECGAESLLSESLERQEMLPGSPNRAVLPRAKSANEPVNMRTYRLALASTSSYSQANGGTKSAVLAAMNTTINMVNAMTEHELALRFQIIDNNDTLIYLDPMTEPYANIEDVLSLLDQNTNIITQVAKVSGASFDVGHVFTGNCNGSVVGIARSKSVCTGDKAKGVTCFRGGLEYVLRNILVHELGHQFGALHSWNNCPAFIEQRSAASAYEPGSGSTIMSYGGSCGSQNIQFSNDAYFHTISLQEIFEFSRQGPGNTCAILTPTNNNAPAVSLPYEDNFFIPIGTPFELKAVATDLNADTLTYCWEQFNRDGITTLDNPQGNAPIFRSFPPTTNSKRVFPRLETILNNSSDPTERLPGYSRDLTFRCTVRDNNHEAGGVTWEEVRFKATASAGPFLITQPNSGDTEWKVGDYMEVSWDVANTDNALVNCKNVNILLSSDGGQTFPHVLARHAPNTGSAFVVVPNVLTQRARIRVEAANNIFFDISNANFEIWPATRAGFALTTTPYAREVCLPATSNITLNTASVFGFDKPVVLDVVEGLPAGAAYSFTANPIRPNDSTVLNLDLGAVESGGQYNIKIRAVAEGLDTIYRTVVYTLFATDFSDQSLDMPVDGTNGIGLTTDFAWTPSVNALRYNFELSNTPTFDSVIAGAQNIFANSFSPSNLRLEENTLHYWRLQPINECGEAPPSDPAVFRTETISCQDIASANVPILISGSGRPTVESVIEITTDGIINDLNVPLIKGSYQPVNSLRISLISPAGTEVVLFNKNCGTTINISMGFDDEAPDALVCPPDDGIVFKPSNALSAFDGENAKGTWRLRFQVVEAGFGGGGGIDEWRLEFCGALTPQSPFVVTNDTLAVLPANTKTISAGELEIGDEDNAPEELKYILIRPPARGVLSLNGSAILTGDSFTQADINSRRLRYAHEGSEPEQDDFTFIVDDGSGGWLPTQTFNIKMELNATSTRDLPVSGDLRFFPNPATDQLWVEWPAPTGREAWLRMYNLQGQLLLQQKIDLLSNRFAVDVSRLLPGMYVVMMQTEEIVRTGKVVVD
jgi:subtilisin-like proprotein convertase family protein